MSDSEQDSHVHSPSLSLDERRVLAEIIPDLVRAIKYPNTSQMNKQVTSSRLEPPIMAGILTNIIQVIETSSETFAPARGLGVSRLNETMPRDQRNRARMCELMEGLDPRTSEGVAQYLNQIGSRLQVLDAASERMSNVLLEAWVRLKLQRKCPLCSDPRNS